MAKLQVILKNMSAECVPEYEVMWNKDGFFSPEEKHPMFINYNVSRIH